MKNKIRKIYSLAFDHFGPQHWWPGESPFEVCVGAILTQNTSWTNVEKAILNLNNENLLSFAKMLEVPPTLIATLIKPVGYFNIKTKRLKNFLSAIHETYGSFEALSEVETSQLREFFLSISGIGPETADSMVLYAFNRPTFVVDAYTKRILMRHSMIDEEADYYRIKDFFEDHLESDAILFNEYHALIVMLGKNYCHKSKPNCAKCPLCIDLSN